MISIPGTVYLSRARLLTALVVFFIGGLMAGELARVVAPPSGLPQPTLRVGTVVNIPEEPTSTHAWVQMVTGEDPIELPLSAGYIPVVGDEVNVLFLATAGSSQGLILSGRAGQAGNLVLNGHFQRSRRMGSSSNNPPYHWTVVTLSGQAPVFNTYLGSSSGLPIAQLYDSPSSGAADHLVYSAAIPVTPGEDITVAA
ncbi:hypothetical protein, partial [Catellatospora sp. NPDC049609]|uniref:hypothetical protein n=1 Tax=Catellatospora sp. NPDC049609 TaxID=3155505 RepID=UPI003428ED6A